MSFLAPFMLLGAAAAAIPIALHFFFRSRYRTVPWAAMKFLLTSIEQTSRRLRFQELLLLITRVAVLLLLALALARPSSFARIGGAGDAADVVLLIDTSGSMDAKEGNGTRLDRAKSAAISVIDHLPPHSTVQIIACADRAEDRGPAQPANLDQAREIVNDLQGTQLASDLTPGLRLAVAALSRGTSPNRELYVFSDMQSLAWERQAAPLAEQWRLARDLAEITLVRCGTTMPRNAAIVGIVPQTGVPRAGERVGFAVLVRNTGAEPLRDLKVTLTPDANPEARESQLLPFLAPGETRSATLSSKWDSPGLRLITATIESDDLACDNRFDLIVPVREQVRVLVVDGAVNEREPEKSASFFLLHALLPIKEADRPRYFLQARLVTPNRAMPALLNDKDLVVLINVAADDDPGKRIEGLSPEFAAALERFVRGGKSLLIFAGDRVEPMAYNRLLGERHDLLPLKLTKIHSPPGEIAIDRASGRDPAFWRFRDDEAYAGLSHVRTARYVDGEELPVGTNARGAEPVVMRFSDGRPLAAARKVGAGRVLMVTTSADTSWTDWPLSVGTFVPFVDVALNYLLLGTVQEHNRSAGEPLRWWVPETDAARPWLVRRPDGRKLRLGLPVPVEGRPMLTATDTQLAGLYRILPADGQEADGVPFALAPDPQETANLETLTDAQLDERLGFAVKHLTVGDDAHAPLGADRSRREWTTWLLMCVLFVAGFESLLAWWCGRAW